MSTPEEREQRKQERRLHEGDTPISVSKFDVLRMCSFWAVISIALGAAIRYLRWASTTDLRIYIRDAEVILIGWDLKPTNNRSF